MNTKTKLAYMLVALLFLCCALFLKFWVALALAVVLFIVLAIRAVKRRKDETPPPGSDP